MNYVGGQYISNQSGETFVSSHPGNENPICEVETAGDAEVALAVAAALAAYKEWSRTAWSLGVDRSSGYQSDRHSGFSCRCDKTGTVTKQVCVKKTT
jgi:hypothetical protein